MRLLYGVALHEWQHSNAIIAEARATMRGYERLIGLYEERISQLEMDIAHYREKAERSTDALLLVNGKPPVAPPARPEELDPFVEDEREVERLQTKMRDDPAAVFASWTEGTGEGHA